jgi:hypothetical protein
MKTKEKKREENRTMKIKTSKKNGERKGRGR